MCVVRSESDRWSRSSGCPKDGKPIQPSNRYLTSARLHATGWVERTVPLWPARAVERLQRSRLRSIIRHAYETVPFYRDAMNERGLRPSDFEPPKTSRDCRLIDRLTVQQQLERFLSIDYTDDRSRSASYSSGSTSGIVATTTGTMIPGPPPGTKRACAPASSGCRRQPRLAPPTGRRRREARRNGHGQARAPAPSDRDVDSVGGHSFVHVALDDTKRLATASWSGRGLFAASVRNRRRTTERVGARLVLSYGSFADHFFARSRNRGTGVHLPLAWDYTGDGISPGPRSSRRSVAASSTPPISPWRLV